MEVIEAERIQEELITRLHLEGGDHEDFRSVRGGVAFPFENLPGVILLGGEKKETGLIKVLVEKEFDSLLDLPEILADFEKRYGFYCIYRSEDPDTETIINHLSIKLRSSPNPTDYRFRAIQGTDNFSYEIQVINHFLKNDKLVVPKNGVLATQLEAGWESFLASEQKLRSILALFFLVLGIDQRDNMSWLCGEEDRGRLR